VYKAIFRRVRATSAPAYRLEKLENRAHFPIRPAGLGNTFYRIYVGDVVTQDELFYSTSKRGIRWQVEILAPELI